MNDYIALRADVSPCSETITDLLASFLADIGYESFVADEAGLTAYIPAGDFNPEELQILKDEFPMECDLVFSHEYIEGQDWNHEWEKNYFKPIIVADKCVVHSSFHQNVPDAEFDIVIDPKMAFGTGHHATTRLIIQVLLEMDLTGKTVIDMGTGTGILAILCAMKGASEVSGIEIDPSAFDNAGENCKLNGVDVNLLLGDAVRLDDIGYEADVFIANINRNVILADLSEYVRKLKSGGAMILSGFIEDDIALMETAASAYGLNVSAKSQEGEWCAMTFVKKQ